MSSKCKWVRLGDYIEECDLRNTELKFGIENVKGMTITKEVIPTKANLEGNDLSKFKIVMPQEFIYNPRTHGKKIGLGINNSDIPFLISWNNTAFRIKDNKTLLPLYLYIFVCREEWDRLACFNSWGSSTEVFSWESLCNMTIPLPSIEEQQKIVNAWQSLREVKEQNEAIATPLMQVCQSYIQELKHKCKKHYRIGNAIRLFERTNSEGKSYAMLGLNKAKQFMPTVANTKDVDIRKYKIVSKGVFAYSGMQTGRDICIRIALYNNETPAIISPAYSTFTLDNNQDILSEYFMLLFTRTEMDRLGWFYSDSSVRSNLDWERFINIEIPLPPIEVQRAIVNIYNCANEAKQIAAEADRMSREACSVLIQHVINN